MGERKAPFCDGSERPLPYTSNKMGLLYPPGGKERFQVRKPATLEGWLHTAVALQGGANTNLTGGEPCLSIQRNHPGKRLQGERSRCLTSTDRSEASDQRTP